MLQPADDQNPAPLREAAEPEIPSPAPARRRPRRRRWPYILLALLVAAIPAAWYGYDSLTSDKIIYVTVPVERGGIEDSTTAAGTLQPYDFVDVGAQVSGQLRKFHVTIGDRVEAGALLAEIDPTVLQSRVEAGRAELIAQKAQLADREAQQRLAKLQFERQQRLRADNATSIEAYQTAEASLASANAQVAVLKAQIQNSESTLKGDEANLGYTRILAPMAGTVVSQTAKQGQTLNTNQQAPIVLRIADLSTMTVQTQVSEADIGRLRVGMEVYFTTLGRPDRRWSSKLRKILPTPEVVNNVVLYNALFDVPNTTGELRTQMTAQVFFVVAKADGALKVPMSALKPAGGRRSGAASDGATAATGGSMHRVTGSAERRFQRARLTGVGGGDAERGGEGRRYRVQVQRPDGSIEDRTIRVGVTNRVSGEVLSGLEEGDKVVIGSYREGDRQGSSRYRRGAQL